MPRGDLFPSGTDFATIFFVAYPLPASSNNFRRLYAFLFGIVAAAVGLALVLAFLQYTRIQLKQYPRVDSDAARADPFYGATKYGVFPSFQPISGSLRLENTKALHLNNFKRILGSPLRWEKVPGTHLTMISPGEYHEIHQANDGSTIFEAYYGIDEFHRRRNVNEERKHATDSVLLLGDSFTFGWGVNPWQTFAAVFGKMLPHTRVYNYGNPGLYPSEFLERLDVAQPQREFPEPPKLAVFFYGEYDIFRDIGSIHETSLLGEQKPYFHEDANGRLVSEGTYAEVRPVWTWLSNTLRKWNLEDRFGISLLPKLNGDDWKLEARILREMRDRTAKLGVKNFAVVIYPGPSPGPHPEDALKLDKLLEEAGIHFVDFSHWDMTELTRRSPYIRGDSHFTPEAHRIFGEALFKALQPLL
jgi:hypothetical protein